MKKKLAVGVLSAALLIGGATAAFAATDSSKLEEIKSLTQQMFGIHQQIVDKSVEAGLITQDQADTMKESMELRQQQREQAIDNGEFFGPGRGGIGMRGGMNFKNIEPLTEEQIQAWDEAMQARLTAQEEAMKASGRYTDEQIKARIDAAKAQLEVKKDALKNGTSAPGSYGMRGNKGMRGGNGMWGGNWGSSDAQGANLTVN